MLKLEDFFHLPQVDTLIQQFVVDGPGLTIVAGMDARPTPAPASAGFLPSGRAVIFRILMREILAAQESARCIAVCEDRTAIRIPRQLRHRITLSLVEPSQTYADHIIAAARRRPDLLVIDRLGAETAPAALEAAQYGLRVLSQLDTLFRGVGVGRHLLDFGVLQRQLGNLRWIVAVQRLATLCPHCKRPAPPDPAQLAMLRQRYPHLDALSLPPSSQVGQSQAQEPAGDIPGAFSRAEGCPRCAHTGRHGDAVIFDIFRADPKASSFWEQSSLLPMERYVWELAALGYLSLDDVLHFESDRFRHTFNQLLASERALVDAHAAMERKLAELEAANRVLEQRTRALISLQDIGQALISSTELGSLAGRVCRHACALGGADRAILYFLRTPDQAEVLAVSGWDSALIHQQLAARSVFTRDSGPEPTPFAQYPPGVLPGMADADGTTLQAGLYVPLITQDKQVGLMIVHTTHKPSFAPGEVALLQTFANQAALALQRAGLFEQLRTKIAQLEAAQVELAQKERMERELELARQVQQSVLPRTFPQIPGYQFAARNEPARQVGGDFYDVITLDQDTFGVAIADVSGKGMPAALYMALTRSLLLAEARRARSPRTVITNVNQLLLELGEPNMFVTVFYGVFERAARRLTYTRAGHDRPLLLREGTVQELPGQGTALGLLDKDDGPVSEERIVLAPGDRLVLYTDGLTDVQAPDGTLFDRERFKALLQPCATLPATELCASVFAQMAAYQGTAEQYDDMTMLVVQVE